MKKVIIVPVVALLAFSLFVFEMKPNIITSADELEYPVEEEGEDSYVYVSNPRCGLSISSGTATVTSAVTGKSGTTSTSITVYLDQLINGTWHRVTSWSHSGGRDQDNIDSTTVSHGTYKVWMSVTASDGNGSESFDMDGNTATY
ncbi:MAG: hypothetical protein IKW90_03345 [Lachnospiraceae bacterium]|nr:hypothetical protein [Lachnospiraceae bacterium]MBR6402540.1 hypothetical protein [Eubacterium sp.]